MTPHVIKIWPEEIKAIISGELWIMRMRGAQFNAGHEIVMKEYHIRNGYTGKRLKTTITRVDNNDGIYKIYFEKPEKL